MENEIRVVYQYKGIDYDISKGLVPIHNIEERTKEIRKDYEPLKEEIISQNGYIIINMVPANFSDNMMFFYSQLSGVDAGLAEKSKSFPGRKG